MRCLAASIATLLLTAQPARAQWQSGDAEAPPRPHVDEATMSRWQKAIYEPPKSAWLPAPRRSVPTLAAGVVLVSAAAVTALVGMPVEAGSQGSQEGTGARIALGGAALASLAIPLIPFGAQRVGYPHRAPGLMYTGMALTFLGGAAGAAGFATWAGSFPRDPTVLPAVLGLAGAGTLALGIPFWAAGSRRPSDMPLEAPTPERPHANDALVVAGVAGLTLGVAAVLMGAGLVWESSDDPVVCPPEFGCPQQPQRHGDRVGEPMMIAGTVLASAGLLAIVLGAPSDSEPSARLGLHSGGIGLSGSF